MKLENNNIVYVHQSSIFSSLGKEVDSMYKKIANHETGLQLIDDGNLIDSPTYLGKINDEEVRLIKEKFNVHTRFDAILLSCLNELINKSTIDLRTNETIIILSTTKGNIDLLECESNSDKLLLSSSAKLLKEHLKNQNEPIIVSNACISGVSALLIAKRLLKNGIYKNAIVIGCDVLSKFVISGFNSFHAISKTICKPFDINRNGISLGEAAAAMLLTTQEKSDIVIGEGFISNDSNHISGPSKTGEELAFCIHESLKKSNLINTDIDFISAHGTATPYNDEMESKAFELVGLVQNPVFSLKAIFGHTLGATGILESIIGIECLRRNQILFSLEFDEIGVSGNIQVSKTLIEKSTKTFLKTASGFGGCNAAMLIHKVI